MQISPLGLDHVVIRVADLDRSIKFYCDILKMSVLEEQLTKMKISHQLWQFTIRKDLEDYLMNCN